MSPKSIANPYLSYIKENLFLCILELITLIAIVVCAILFDQPFLNLLPLLISLIVMFLTAQVNRYCFLLGGVNSLIYAISDFTRLLYASAFQALLISFPIQVITFIRWNRRSRGSVTGLKSLNKKQLIILLGAMLTSWLGLLALLSLSGLDSPYKLLDITVTVIGTGGTVLSLLCFREYTVFNLISLPIGLLTQISVFLNDPSQLSYVIYYVFSFVCFILARIRVKKQQRDEEQTKAVGK